MKGSGGENTSPFRPSRQASAKETILFEYVDPSVKVVTGVEDFHQWNLNAVAEAGRRRPLERQGTAGSVQLSIKYKFVVNGERWAEDPSNLLRIMNEHGTVNPIRNVGASPEGRPGLTT